MSRLVTCATCAAIDCQRHPVTTWQGGSTRAWRRLRARVLVRDDYRCQHCGKPATHADHVLPKAAGGSDHIGNLEALCTDCNLLKGDAMPTTQGYGPFAAAPADTQPATARADFSDRGAGRER
ncbi:MAG: 5-methylcytosine-specific restriction enzyme [Gaiellaceae bacterium]|jgi:5-methylcytosine-specific restriction endonuclease McrA|nr:5-methylcytosine-specific restriction enzyme [Gaiellaceae bacterium]